MSVKLFAALAALAAAMPSAAEEPLWPEGLILFPPVPRPPRPRSAAAPAASPPPRPAPRRTPPAPTARVASPPAPAPAPSGACGPRALEEIETSARPGDLLLVRRDAEAAPGAWWRRAAVYVGAPEDRAAWLRSEDLEAALNAEAPDAYWANLRRGPDGRPSFGPTEGRHAGASAPAGRPSVVVEEPSGARLVSLRALGADAIALLRPRLPAAGRAALLRRAFAAVGRPAGRPSLGPTEGRHAGASAPAGALSARPGDDWARAFDLEFGRPEAHVDLIRFFERRSPGQRATRSGIEEFRRTWRRPATAGVHKEE